ncbi:uncharacterized protein O3C94_018215 [Discoglossus pictus]
MAPVVGIFSRSGKDDYCWLISGLGNMVDVRPCYISNNDSHALRQMAQQCNFAILYHTKKRGRVNITNVTDSLYDDELQSLSNILGKEKVIVVADDLDDSDPNTRQRILQNQSSIGRKAKELFLVSVADKNNSDRMRRQIDDIISLIIPGRPDPSTQYQSNPENSTFEIHTIKEPFVNFSGLEISLILLFAFWLYFIPNNDISIILPVAVITILTPVGSGVLIYVVSSAHPYSERNVLPKPVFPHSEKKVPSFQKWMNQLLFSQNILLVVVLILLETFIINWIFLIPFFATMIVTALSTIAESRIIDLWCAGQYQLKGIIIVITSEAILTFLKIWIFSE